MPVRRHAHIFEQVLRYRLYRHVTIPLLARMYLSYDALLGLAGGDLFRVGRLLRWGGRAPSLRVNVIKHGKLAIFD